MNLDVEPAGALITAGLAASEIEGGGAAGRTHGAHGANCANCKATLAGEFCHSCGQRAHIHKSLLHLGEEVLHGLLHFDAKGWRTLPMLVGRPGQLTRRYVDGQRTRFVSPLALFLFMIFLMFFVVSFVSDGSKKDDGTAPSTTDSFDKARGKLDKAFQRSMAGLAKAESKLAAAKGKGDDQDAAEAASDVKEARNDVAEAQRARTIFEAAAGSPAEKAAAVAKALEAAPKGGHTSNFNVDTGSPSVDGAIRHAVDNPELTLYKLKNSASKFSFLLVPISLPFLWLMFFWRRGITMYDHAVFVLYSLSFMALLVVVLALLAMAGMKGSIAILACFIPPVHMFMQLRGTYALGVFSALWRTMALLFVSGTVFALYILLISILSMR